jgi:dihydrofolate reductase
MGSKTLLSLLKSQPLKDRINLVVTNKFEKYSKMYCNYNNVFFMDIDNAINIIKYCYKYKTVFIIGGNQIYNLLIPYCSTIWLTKIKANYECELIFNYDISKFEKTVIEEDDELEIIQLN